MGLNMIHISRSCPMPSCHKHQHISLKLAVSPIIFILKLCLMPSSSLMLVHTPTDVYKQEVSQACRKESKRIKRYLEKVGTFHAD